MVTTRHRIALLVAACLTSVAAGCAKQDTDAISGVVWNLMEAAAAGDGEAACETLAPQTIAELEQSAGKPCAEAIADEDLPQPGAVERVDVYGQWARVVTSDDTVFLGAFGDGWRVVAAGCRSRGEAPYNCLLQGD